MEIVEISNKNAFEKAVECLKNGGILIYPTETCYGVGVDATNKKAVSKLLEYKKRPEGKPISIGASSQEMATKYVSLNDTAENIYKNFLPGPVTVVSKSKGVVDRRLESEKGSLGIRIPNYQFILDVIAKFGKPITTTSANPSGKKTPYSIADILATTSKKQQGLVGLVIDAGELPHNPPSTVIDTTIQELTVYRKGEVVPSLQSPVSSLTSKSVNETIKIAEALTSRLNTDIQGPLIFLLYGDLGAGKTQFVKGIAKALGINQNIKSPTYTYVSEYPFSLTHRKRSPLSLPTGHAGIHGEGDPTKVGTDAAGEVGKLYHFDAWRVQNLDDLNALAYESWLKDGNVIAIEWPNVVLNLKNDLFDKYKIVKVEIFTVDETTRQIKSKITNH